MTGVKSAGRSVFSSPSQRCAQLGRARALIGRLPGAHWVAGHRAPIMPIIVTPRSLLYDNLIKSVAFILPMSIAQALVILFSVFFFPVRDGDLLFRVLFVGLLIAVGTSGLFLWEYRVELSLGVPEARAIVEGQTMAVTAIILFQMFYLLNCWDFAILSRALKFSFDF